MVSSSSSASRSVKLRSPSTWCEDEVPSPTWRTFLRNHAEGIAAIDMFVVMSASFRPLYVTVILAHERRTIIHTAVTETSHCGLVIASGNRSVSMGHCSALSAARSRCLV